MSLTKLLVPIAIALMLVGAGCKSEVATNVNGGLVLPAESKDTATESAMMEEKPKAAEVDATWKEYTNAALKFGFKSPTKGRYAPVWAVNFHKADDSSIKDGCFVAAGATTGMMKVGEQDFCHTAVTAADEKTATDYYTTKVSGQYVVLVFTKKHDGSKDFSWSDYRTNLGAVVSTWATTK